MPSPAAVDRDRPHLPRSAPIDAYGSGGFRFAGMSHRGALICVPSGIWASNVRTPQDIDAASLAIVWGEVPPVELCLIGTGSTSWAMPRALRERLGEHAVTMEVMTTGAAVRTYNILLGENRRVAALLIPVA
jgi:uncharacterized protein